MDYIDEYKADCIDCLADQMEDLNDAMLESCEDDWSNGLVCLICGTKYGNWHQPDTEHWRPKVHYATYHIGNCSICKLTDVVVTEERDFGYLVKDRK
jgi:hypothetical protein